MLAGRALWRSLIGLPPLLVCALATVWLWLHPHFDYFYDDGGIHAVRVYLLDAALRQGDWYPRWFPELQFGYGYPVLNYYSPGLYYLAELIHLLGPSIYRSLQLLGALTVLLGATGGYTLGLTLFGSPLGGLMLGGALVLAPYPFLTNLYNRGAFPEALATAILPWLLAAAVWLTRRPTGPRVVALASCLAAVILTHTLSALIQLPLLLAWVGTLTIASPVHQRARRAAASACALVLGLSLSAFFWFPAVAEVGAAHAELGRASGAHLLIQPLAGANTATSFRDALPFDTHRFFPFAPDGVVGPQKPGLGQIVAIAAGLGLVTLQRRRPPPHPRSHIPAVVLLAGVVALGAWLLNTSWVSVLWSASGPLSVVQYPWRLYGLFSLFAAVIAAWGVSVSPHARWLRWSVTLAVLAVMGVNVLGIRPWSGRMKDPVERGDWARGYLQSKGEIVGATTTTTFGEYLPRSVHLVLPRQLGRGGYTAYEAWYPADRWIAGRVWPFSDAIQVQEVSSTPRETQVKLRVSGQAAADVGFKTLVFPGWRAYVDGAPAAIRPAPLIPAAEHGHGFAIVAVPPGEHEVRLVFESTPARMVGSVLSGIGVMAFAILIGLWVRRSRSTTVGAGVRYTFPG